MDNYNIAIAKVAAADLGGFKEIIIEALKEKQERENPKPLTLDELRERVGKSVWVDCIKCKHLNCYGLVCLKRHGHVFGNYSTFLFDDYGELWNAYDHPPKEAKP